MSRNQRAFRARKRELARAEWFGAQNEITVECAHGNHTLRVIFDTKNVIRHVSTTCTRRPPSPDLQAVMRGLHGDTYTCCSIRRAQVIDAVRAPSSQWYVYRDRLLNHRQEVTVGHDIALAEYRAHTGAIERRKTRVSQVVPSIHAQFCKTIEDKVAKTIPTGVPWRVYVLPSPDEQPELAKSNLVQSVHRRGIEMKILNTENNAEVFLRCQGGRVTLHYTRPWHTTRVDNPLAGKTIERAVLEKLSPVNLKGKRVCPMCGTTMKRGSSAHYSTEPHKQAVLRLLAKVAESFAGRFIKNTDTVSG